MDDPVNSLDRVIEGSRRRKIVNKCKLEGTCILRSVLNHSFGLGSGSGDCPKGAQVDRASETASKMDDTKGTTPTPTAAEEPQVWLRNLSFLVTPPLTLISAGPAVCTNLDMMITIVRGVLLFLLPWSIGKGISGPLPA